MSLPQLSPGLHGITRRHVASAEQRARAGYARFILRCLLPLLVDCFTTVAVTFFQQQAQNQGQNRYLRN